MNGQGWFVDQNKCLVHTSEVGVPDPSRGETVARTAGSPGTRTPITSRFRKIGNPSPGLWNDIKGWWTGLKPEYRYGIVGGLGLLGVIVAAVQGKGKPSSLKKI